MSGRPVQGCFADRDIVKEMPPPNDMPPGAAGLLVNARPTDKKTDAVGDADAATPTPTSVSCEPDANDRPKFPVTLVRRPAAISAAMVPKTDPLEKYPVEP